MADDRRAPTAAPPDEAGHQGSYTRPEDILETHAADSPPREPALHRDRDRLKGTADGASPVAMIVWALIFVAITAFFLLVRA